MAKLALTKMKTKNSSYQEQPRGNEYFGIRVHDWIEQAEKYHSPTITPFLNESEVAIVKKICGNKIAYHEDGGYDEANYKRVIFLPNREDDFSLVVCLVATFNPKFNEIGHRDVLGALMNLQIARNQIGDLWVEGNRIILYTTHSQSAYIQQNCTKIKRSSIQFNESSQHYAQVINRIKSTVSVSSERLDAVISAMIQKPRGIAQDLIRDGSVKVNHEILEDSSKLCNNEDTISIRGFGKYIYRGVIKTTKKDRYLIEFEKYS